MNAMLGCTACGAVSYDVAMTIVEVPEAERRMVNVELPPRMMRRGAAPLLETIEVPELYAREPRCRDTAACRTRAEAG